MNDFFYYISLFYSLFLGAFILSGLIFFIQYSVTKNHHSKQYLTLSFALAGYAAICLQMPMDLPLSYKTYFLMPMSTTLAYFSFYLYFKIITDRFRLYGRFINFLRKGVFGAFLFFGLVTFLANLGLGELFVREAPTPSRNLFMQASVQNFRATWICFLAGGIGISFTLAGNIYLLFKLAQKNLKGFEYLAIIGLVASLVVAANDFLLSSGRLTHLIPVAFVGFIFEIFYFHFLAMKEHLTSNRDQNSQVSPP